MPDSLRISLGRSQIRSQPQPGASPRWALEMPPAAAARKAGYHLPEKRFPVVIRADGPIATAEKLQELLGMDSLPETMNTLKFYPTSKYCPRNGHIEEKEAQICSIDCSQLLYLETHAEFRKAVVWFQDRKRHALDVLRLVPEGIDPERNFVGREGAEADVDDMREILQWRSQKQREEGTFHPDCSCEEDRDFLLEEAGIPPQEWYPVVIRPDGPISSAEKLYELLKSRTFLDHVPEVVNTFKVCRIDDAINGQRVQICLVNWPRILALEVRSVFRQTPVWFQDTRRCALDALEIVPESDYVGHEGLKLKYSVPWIRREEHRARGRDMGATVVLEGWVKLQSDTSLPALVNTPDGPISSKDDLKKLLDLPKWPYSSTVVAEHFDGRWIRDEQLTSICELEPPEMLKLESCTEYRRAKRVWVKGQKLFALEVVRVVPKGQGKELKDGDSDVPDLKAGCQRGGRRGGKRAKREESGHTSRYWNLEMPPVESARKAGYHLPEKRFPVVIRADGPVATAEKLQELLGIESVPELHTTTKNFPTNQEVDGQEVQICPVDCNQLLYLEKHTYFKKTNVLFEGKDRDALDVCQIVPGGVDERFSWLGRDGDCWEVEDQIDVYAGFLREPFQPDCSCQIERYEGVWKNYEGHWTQLDDCYPVIIRPDGPINSAERIQELVTIRRMQEVPEVVDTFKICRFNDAIDGQKVQVCQLNWGQILQVEARTVFRMTTVWFQDKRRCALDALEVDHGAYRFTGHEGKIENELPEPRSAMGWKFTNAKAAYMYGWMDGKAQKCNIILRSNGPISSAERLQELLDLILTPKERSTAVLEKDADEDKAERKAFPVCVLGDYGFSKLRACAEYRRHPVRIGVLREDALDVIRIVPQGEGKELENGDLDLPDPEPVGKAEETETRSDIDCKAEPEIQQRPAHPLTTVTTMEADLTEEDSITISLESMD